MVIGILQVELTIDGATSLKDKRSVVRSIKDRLHREHQVSVAEVGSQDEHRKAVLGIVLAATEVNYCQSVLDTILDKLTQQHGCYVSDHKKEILTGQ